MYTREQLVSLALQHLGVKQAGQPYYPEDYQVVDLLVPAVLDDLAERNIFTWGDPDQLPDSAAIHLAVCLANTDARPFGKEPDEAKRLLAESRLRELKQVILSGQPQQTEYF